MSISLSGVGVRLGDTDVLRDVNLVSDSRTIAVIGENGSGKSTFARLIGGLITRTTGDVSVLGLDPTKDAEQFRRSRAFVFSNPDAQIVMPTVVEDVAFSLRPQRLPRASVDARVSAALERFGLTGIAGRSSHDLSGGQKQLLALCGAFVRDPALVIADEPTAYLDARNARRVADHLFEGEHQLILVTHDLALAARCETAVLFNDGTIAHAGETAEVISRYRVMLEC